MHERSTKSKPLDVVQYEIEMFRHCARTLKAKHEDMSISQAHTGEYYLGLEGFLLHLRNLLAFFMNHCPEATDLGINKTHLWRGKCKINQREYSDLIKGARAINQRFETANGTLYVQISRFLQHCTTFRYTSARSWNVEGIFKAFDPLLRAFEERFIQGAQAGETQSAVETQSNEQALDGS